METWLVVCHCSTAMDGEASWLVELTLTALSKPFLDQGTACSKSARTQIISGQCLVWLSLCLKQVVNADVQHICACTLKTILQKCRNKILGISWGYLRDISGTSQGYLRDIFGISWGYHGDIMGISWGYPGDILGISWGYLGDILGVSWGCLGNILGICWGYLGNIMGIS